MKFEEVLNEKGYLVYYTVGVSMLPLLRQKKDIVIIEAKGKERCRKYDAVLFKRGGKYVLHRILKVRPDDYVIVGDNQYIREYGVTDEQILGIMTRLIRNGKEISVRNKWYLLYVHLWCDFYPIRAGILFAKACTGKGLRRLRRVLEK